ncbi:MAG TPA: hypothetical protein VLL52_00515 [Anaerolineae bacterium]|nr:hypothetical protein [Anaerolineae bacterium]
MRRLLTYLGLFLILLIAPLFARYTGFYRLANTPAIPTPPAYEPLNLVTIIDANAPAPTPPSPTSANHTGYILLDLAHDNQFQQQELNYLDSQLAARGFNFLPYTGDTSLASALRSVPAMVIVTPQIAYDETELTALTDFVNRGGHLFLVGDPTRFQIEIIEDEYTIDLLINQDDYPLNSIANLFGIVYQGDYLYNTTRNEGNFRHIIVPAAGMAEAGLTADLEEIVFYGTHSVAVTNQAGRTLLQVDDDTRSSTTDRPQPLALAVTAAQDRVVAVGDIDFLLPPYYTTANNTTFIARIADFLTASANRQWQWPDFPFFLPAENYFNYLGQPEWTPDLQQDFVTWQQQLTTLNKQINLGQPNQTNIQLGLYNHAPAVTPLLATHGITITISPPLTTTQTTSDTTSTEQMMHLPWAQVPLAGTALLLADWEANPAQLLVLAASEAGLDNTLDRLLSASHRDAPNMFSDCLIQTNIALCPTNIDAEILAVDWGGATDDATNDDDNTSDDDTANDDTPNDDTANDDTANDDTTNDDTANDDTATDDTANDDTSDDNNAGGLNATPQGALTIGEPVTGQLSGNEGHAWYLGGGPALVDITVTSQDDIDLVVELYDSNNELIRAVDDGYSGERERMLTVSLPADDIYTIVVREFFEEVGSYELSVTEAAVASNRVFVFIDDDGTPLDGGHDSETVWQAYFDDSFEVDIWRSSVDGRLSTDSLDGYAFVVWDSGDYQTADVFADEDLGILWLYLYTGGHLILSGSSPALFGEIDTAPLQDLTILTTDSPLTNGWTDGEAITLEGEWQTAVLNESNETDFDESAIIVFTRGANSEYSGETVAAGLEDDTIDAQIFIIALPFSALPDDTQTTMLNNIIDWFELP